MICLFFFFFGKFVWYPPIYLNLVLKDGSFRPSQLRGFWALFLKSIVSSSASRAFFPLWCYPRATAKCSMFYESFGQLCSKIQNRASHVFSCDFVSWPLSLRANTYNESSLKLDINIYIWNYMYFSF